MSRITIEAHSDWTVITSAECLFEAQYDTRGIGDSPKLNVTFSATTPADDVWFTLPTFSMCQYVPNADFLWIRNKSDIPVSIVVKEI